MRKKIEDLENRLEKLSSICVAFSGGVDSTFLLAVAKKINPEKLVAITVASQFVPKREIVFAKRIAHSMGVEHRVHDVDILANEDVALNNKDRCFFCKKQVFLLVKESAQSLSVNHYLHAVNLDDLTDYRPGLKAAEELGFLSPLADAKFTKMEIRLASKQLGLETWDKASQSCLATRIPYDTKISAKSLIMIDAAEAFLQDLGFDQVRVRCHGKMARIEVVPKLIDKMMECDIRQNISIEFKKIGFAYTCVDIAGYKTGNMNDEILKPGRV
ncbi:MAG: ATP-dependent sacrificial sulfur transferase LarE [Desulfobacteraceae bacterium]|nr:ATP-dependent sacrificial sulfur transferase LarE [Desulfobacteraceae bacterium]